MASERVKELDELNAELAGHGNHKQKIHYVAKLKSELQGSSARKSGAAIGLGLSDVEFLEPSREVEVAMSHEQVMKKSCTSNEQVMNKSLSIKS